MLNVHFAEGPVKFFPWTITDLWLSGLGDRTFIKMAIVPSSYQKLLKWQMDLEKTQRMVTIIATRDDVIQFWILCVLGTKNLPDTLDSIIIVTQIFNLI